MENQRIRISKTMLKNALIQLLKEKTLDKITIYELCNTAQINRTTFYKYYGSQYDLLKDIEEDFFNDLEEHLLLDSPFKQNALHKTMQYLFANQEKCQVLINSITDGSLSERLFSLPAIREALNEYASPDMPEYMRKYISIFFCEGGFAIIRDWLNGGCKESPEEIAGLICMLDAYSEDIKTKIASAVE